jgi:hypothetical protein
MSDFSDFSIFYRQNALPRRLAREMEYQEGFALGVEAGQRGDRNLRGLLTDAWVLTARHDSIPVAARLLHIAENGLRGFLDGAGKPPFPIGVWSEAPTLAAVQGA